MPEPLSCKQLIDILIGFLCPDRQIIDESIEVVKKYIYTVGFSLEVFPHPHLGPNSVPLATPEELIAIVNGLIRHTPPQSIVTESLYEFQLAELRRARDKERHPTASGIVVDWKPYPSNQWAHIAIAADHALNEWNK
jgi:hypothetical protein